MENIYYKNNKKLEELNHFTIHHELTNFNLDTYKIVKCLLTDFCDIDICGYNTYKKLYWGKKIKNRICVLLFTLEFLENYIKIIPIFGSDIYVKELYINLHEGLEIYKTSSFLFD